MLPSEQGLCTDDSSVIGANLWLKIQNEFLVDPCASEFIVEGATRLGFGPKRWNEVPDTPTTGAFCTVQG
jgi:hypothetical protein